MTELKDWKIFQGSRDPHNAIQFLPDPPKWRRFNNQDESTINKSEIIERWKKLQDLANKNIRDKERGRNFCIKNNQCNDDNNDTYNDVVDAVNAALYLRRPLLVTGKPGSGKTSLAYAVAYELQLGPVLLWPITTRSTLQEGLYRYDAIARLQDVQLADQNRDKQLNNNNQHIQLRLRLQDSKLVDEQNHNNQNIGKYIQLGSVGTAFLPSFYPRVLLIDEIDKSDINLPNDLLNLFEDGEFEIPELARMSKYIGEHEVLVRTKDGSIDAPIKAGRVCCSTFPLIIMTSNGERDFPPAFLRRCIRVNMPKPKEEDITAIVKSQMDEEILKQSQELIKFFVTSLDKGDNIAIDQLLNTVYLITNEKIHLNEINLEKMKRLLLKNLSSTEDR